MNKELKKKSIKDLNKILKESGEKLREFRFGSAGSKVRNVKEGNNLRKTVARVLTELTARVQSTPTPPEATKGK